VNEKRNKIQIWIIIILAITTIVSTSFAIYYGRTGDHAYADKLRNTVAQLERTNDELERTNSELIREHAAMGENLGTALDDLRAMGEYTSQLELERERSLDISRRTNEGLTSLTRAMAESGGTLAIIIDRQQRIDRIVRELWEINNQP